MVVVESSGPPLVSTQISAKTLRALMHEMMATRPIWGSMRGRVRYRWRWTRPAPSRSADS
ncbi:hypothetical protein D3C87_2147250 [compost metagenome]